MTVDQDLQLAREQSAIFTTVIETYSKERQLPYTLRALPMVRMIALEGKERWVYRDKSEGYRWNQFRHCLATCRMLLELDLPFSKEEEDVILASTLCHILPEMLREVDVAKVIENRGMSKEIVDLVMKGYRKEGMTERENREFFRSLWDDRKAVLIQMADRGSLMERVYGLASFSARTYLYEARVYFYPMCIHAKQLYPELSAQLSVLMEKMRCLSEAAEIIMSRYEQIEKGLMDEILALQEENATLKGIIASAE